MLRRCDICQGELTGNPRKKRCSKACVTEYTRRWMRDKKLKDPEEVRERTAAYYQNTQDRRLEVARVWRNENKVRHKEMVKRWWGRNPERASIYCQAYRSRKVKAPGTYTITEWLDLQTVFDGMCAYCGDVKTLTKEHVIPLSRVEKNPTNDASNILPVCSSCNSSKCNRLLTEWRLPIVEPLAQLFDEWNPSLAVAIRTV